MGTYYSAYLNVGFLIKRSEIDSIFLKIEGEDKYEYEDRYDPKTGKKIDPVKIKLAQAKKIYKYNNISSDYINEFVELLADSLNINVEEAFSDNNQFIFYINCKEVPTKKDYGRVCIGNSLDYNDLINKQLSLNDLKEMLKSLGFNPKEPIVALCQRVG